MHGTAEDNSGHRSGRAAVCLSFECVQIGYQGNAPSTMRIPAHHSGGGQHPSTDSKAVPPEGVPPVKALLEGRGDGDAR